MASVVRRAPTSRGRVSVTLSSALDTAGTISANVSLHVLAASSAAQVATLFLRASDAYRMSSVSDNGKPYTKFDATQETVAVARPQIGGSVLVEIHYKKK